MINGKDPIIVFHIFNKPAQTIFGPKTEFDQRLSDIRAMVGFPIPIALNERFTGIYVVSESRGIGIETIVDPVTEKDDFTLETKPPIVTQTGAFSDVSIKMFASKNSIMLTAFLAIAEYIVSKATSGEYGISYFNGPTVIFNGLLSRFQTNVDSNRDLIDIDINLSTAKKVAPTLPGVPPKGPDPIPVVSGTSLGPTGVTP